MYIVTYEIENQGNSALLAFGGERKAIPVLSTTDHDVVNATIKAWRTIAAVKIDLKKVTVYHVETSYGEYTGRVTDVTGDFI